MVEVGERITARLAKARWAWSELTSPRFGTKWATSAKDGLRLLSLAHDGAEFDNLSTDDQDSLASLTEKVRASLMWAIAPVKEFECMAWTKADVEQSYALPILSPSKRQVILYQEFLNGQPHLGSQDPRISADRWPANKPFQQKEPAIAIFLRQDIKMLVDGYCRSVIFMRHGKFGDRFLVWEPV